MTLGKVITLYTSCRTLYTSSCTRHHHVHVIHKKFNTLNCSYFHKSAPYFIKYLFAGAVFILLLSLAFISDVIVFIEQHIFWVHVALTYINNYKRDRIFNINKGPSNHAPELLLFNELFSCCRSIGNYLLRL